MPKEDPSDMTNQIAPTGSADKNNHARPAKDITVNDLVTKGLAVQAGDTGDLVQSIKRMLNSITGTSNPNVPPLDESKLMTATDMDRVRDFQDTHGLQDHTGVDHETLRVLSAAAAGGSERVGPLSQLHTGWTPKRA
jgi:hypothetical protein